MTAPDDAVAFWRRQARLHREATPCAAEPARWLRARAVWADRMADLTTLDGLDLSADPPGWSVVDALTGPG